ncbi:MAG: hypothetical protein FWG14_06175 [Peptococcaceae bacterium]|nr:hypothetical protein [Peptococcaceae bacterium]
MFNLKRTSLTTIILIIAILTGIVANGILINPGGATEIESSRADGQQSIQGFPQLSEKERLDIGEFINSSSYRYSSHNYRPTVYQFFKAYFTGDTDKVKWHLANPNDDDLNSLPTEKRSFDDVTVFVIKIYSHRYYENDGGKIEEVRALIEYGDVREDHLCYLDTIMINADIDLINTDDEWKAEWKVTKFGVP